jgi:hypothetical protein
MAHPVARVGERLPGFRHELPIVARGEGRRSVGLRRIPDRMDGSRPQHGPRLSRHSGTEDFTSESIRSRRVTSNAATSSSEVATEFDERNHEETHTAIAEQSTPRRARMGSRPNDSGREMPIHYLRQSRSRKIHISAADVQNRRARVVGYFERK